MWCAAREFYEEGGRYIGGKYLDLSKWIKSHWRHTHGSCTAYFIGKAPRKTYWEQHPKNNETTGGYWMSLRKLEDLARKGKLRFEKPVLFFARRVLKK